MKKDDNLDIDLLIAKILSNEADIDDILYFNELLNHNKINKQEVLLLKKFWQIEVEADLQKDLAAEIAFEKLQKRLNRKAYLRLGLRFLTAASVILLLFTAFVFNWYHTLNKTSQSYSYFNGDQTIRLDDGTLVYLNKGSQLSFTDRYNNTDREVKLDGEAYFDVIKGAMPFKVDLGQAHIEVLGTKFNVKAFSSSKQIITTLEEGAVIFNCNSSKTELKPNQQLIYNKTNSQISIQSIESVIASSWKDGLYKYSAMSMQQLCNELEQIYQIKIELDKRLQSILVSGSFEYTMTIEQVLDVIKKSLPFHWTQVNNTIVIK